MEHAIRFGINFPILHIFNDSLIIHIYLSHHHETNYFPLECSQAPIEQHNSICMMSYDGGTNGILKPVDMM